MSVDNSRRQNTTQSIDASKTAPVEVEQRIHELEQFWEDDDTAHSMINQLLTDSFDERIEVHAENLAERLLQRQKDLDRREVQLTRWAAELENNFRQARLQGKPIDIESEITASTEAEEQEEQDLIDEDAAIHRLDRYCEAQRMPYSDFSVRLKKYAQQEQALATSRTKPTEPEASETQTEETSSESDLSDKIKQIRLDEPQPASTEFPQLEFRIDPPEVKTPTAKPAVNTSLEQLSRQASMLRKRGEAIDSMYEDVTGVFAEVLRQQRVMRTIVKQLASTQEKANASELASVETTLDRLKMQLVKIGSKHFPIVEEAGNAAGIRA